MMDKKDINMLMFIVLWLLVTIWSALDGLTLFISIWSGVGIILYAETVKQWNYHGVSWEFIVLFMGSVLTFSTAIVYLFSIVGFVDRVDIGPVYLARLTSGYAGLIMYIGFQARLLRKQHQQIRKGLRRINGDKS